MVNQDFSIELEKTYKGVKYTVISSESNGTLMNTIDVIKNSKGKILIKKRYEWKILFDKFI